MPQASFFVAIRSLEIAADLNNLAKASTLEAVPQPLQPTANAAAYADYVGRLGVKCTEEDAPDDIEAAALRHAIVLSSPNKILDSCA